MHSAERRGYIKMDEQLAELSVARDFAWDT
jgi:hypothetical protein